MKRVLEMLNVLILLTLLGIVVLTIIYRTLLGTSTLWSEELSQFSFIFLVFVGSAALMADDSHLRITSISDLLSERGKKLLRIFERAAVLLFLLPFTYGAYLNAVVNWDVSLDTAQWMKIGYMYAVLLGSGVIMTCYCVMHIYNDCRGVPVSRAEPELEI